jgi:hypothetical protein
MRYTPELAVISCVDYGSLASVVGDTKERLEYHIRIVDCAAAYSITCNLRINWRLYG